MLSSVEVVETVGETLALYKNIMRVIDPVMIAKGGHPSDIENLQLAHWTCNRQKSDRLMQPHDPGEAAEVITNRNLPHSVDWLAFELKLEQQKSGTS